jgi:hypothetical protein
VGREVSADTTGPHARDRRWRKGLTKGAMVVSVRQQLGHTHRLVRGPSRQKPAQCMAFLFLFCFFFSFLNSNFKFEFCHESHI